jgi:hypothetical protein
MGQRLGIDDVIAVASAQHFDRLRSIRWDVRDDDAKVLLGGVSNGHSTT